LLFSSFVRSNVFTRTGWVPGQFFLGVNHVLQEHQHVLRSNHGQVVDTTLEPNGLIDVGKDRFNDIVLKAENIQDHHARFKVVGDKVSLTNYASSGTFVRHQSPAPGNTSPWMKLKRNQIFKTTAMRLDSELRSLSTDSNTNQTLILGSH
jgi:hypothetical protein